MNNKVSIIIPCYNQAHFLNDAVKSIIDQTHDNWECIIVNDGSTDETEKYALKLAEKDNRIIYHKKSNGGLSSARNVGLNLASGDFIQFLDADDYLYKTKFEKSIIALNSNRDVKIVISNFRMFQNEIEQSTNPYYVLKLDYFNFKSVLMNWDDLFTIPIHCGFFLNSVLKDLRFNEQLKAKEDWLFWITAFKNNKSFFIDQVLAFYRIHNKSMTREGRLMSENHEKAYAEIKKIISNQEYEDFLLEKTIQFYRKNVSLKGEIDSLKNSKFYKIERKFNSILKNFKKSKK